MKEKPMDVKPDDNTRAWGEVLAADRTAIDTNRRAFMDEMAESRRVTPEGLERLRQSMKQEPIDPTSLFKHQTVGEALGPDFLERALSSRFCFSSAPSVSPETIEQIRTGIKNLIKEARSGK